MKKAAGLAGVKLQVIALSENSIPSLTSQVNEATIDPDSQVILILKDHFMVSSVQYLLRLAKKRNLLIYTCDEGSVAEGAHFALGVSEESIGVSAAELAWQIEQNLFDPCQGHTIPLRKLSIFVNKKWYEDTSDSCGPAATARASLSKQDLELR